MRKFVLLSFFLVVVFSLFAQSPQQGWDFVCPTDQFTSEALLDLRFLNEDYAGQNGFITLSADSNSFLTSNGMPVRFWAVNGATEANKMSDSDLARYARFLAKLGVNVIRYHGSLHPVNSWEPLDKANSSEIYNIQRVVAAMKKEGIYTTISPYYTQMVSKVFDNWGIAGYSANDKKMEGVIFFHDGLKNAYKKWVQELYTAPNPFTGVPLKDEPAVALIQTQNEDGLFWYTISSVKPELQKVINQKFYSWLINKYKSIDEAQKAWGNVSVSGDNSMVGEMALFHIWDATQNQTGAKQLRLTDQIQFLAETQRSFYQEIYQHYRAIGCKQLINSSNWKPADAVRLMDAERWTNSVADVIATNRYYSPGHTGYKSSPDNSAWRIDPGHYYEGKSVLLAPEKLPINIKQPVGHPVVVTESGWNLPHKYQAEGPFLIAAYMSLTGVDAFYWFNPTTSGYDPNPYFYWTNLAGGQHPLSRWSVSIPGQLAMFPANALSYRLGYIAESKTLVNEERSLKSIYQREIPVVSEEMGFDPNRDAYEPVLGQTELSPISYLAGKIQVKYNTAQNSKKIDSSLSSLLNFSAKTIVSSTGELNWDYKKGICTINTPSAQGICGFANQTGAIKLKDVTITSQNDYVAVNVVAMDKLPLSQSSKILVQVGTVYQPTQWSETATAFDNKGVPTNGFRIDNTGVMPWKAAQTRVSLKIRNTLVKSATLLDVAGYPAKAIPYTRSGDEITIDLPDNAMYVVLQADKTSGFSETKHSGKMKIYPNPTDGKYFVEVLPGFEEKLNFELINELGQKIYEKKSITDQKIEFDLKSCNSGVYFALLKNGQIIREVQKLILKN